MEIWKNVIGYENLYKISNYGNIYSVVKQKSKSTRKKPNGYIIVDLCKNGIVHTKHIHRLVAEAFIPNPNGLPQVNHIDGNKQNNCVDNLEWCTCKENMQHAVENGLIKKGENHKLYKRKLSDETVLKMKNYHQKHKYDRSKKINQYDFQGNYIKTWNSINDAILFYNNKAIEFCCKNRRKSASGYQWKFFDNNTENILPYKKERK